MRLRYPIVLATAALLVLGAAAASAQTYHAHLDAAHEVPINPSLGFGTGVATLVGTTLSYDVTFKGLLAGTTAAHFHGPAAPGVNAGVRFALAFTTGITQGHWAGSVGPLTAAHIADLNNGLWYLNIHTTLYPGGEIRGQVYSVPTAASSTTWGRVKKLYR